MQKQMIVRALDQNTSVHLTKGKGVLGSLASHFHCAYIIGMVDRGRMELTYEETRVQLTAGSYYLMNPFAVHHIRFMEPTDYEVINLKYDDVKRFAGEIQLHNMYGKDAMFYQSLREIYELMRSDSVGFEERQHTIKQLLDLFINEQILRL